MTKKRKAQIVLAVIGLVLALIIGRQWATNDSPLWMDLVGFLALVVLLGVISRLVEWAFNAINSKENDR